MPIRAAVAGWASAVAADKLRASDAMRLMDELSPSITDGDIAAVYRLCEYFAAADDIEPTPHYQARMRGHLQRRAARLRRA